MGKWVDLGKKIVMRKYLLPILLIGFWGCEDDTSNDSLDELIKLIKKNGDWVNP